MAAIVTLTVNPALDIATAADRILPSHKIRCDTPHYDPGGGGINVARAVRALGGSALAIFPAGGGSGDKLRQLLRQEGVRYRSIEIDGSSRESLSVVERDTGNQYRFVMPGPKIGKAGVQACLKELALAAPAATFIVASGSLPPGLPDHFYRRVARLMRRLGKRVVLDTSGPALSEAGGGFFLLKPSLRELEELTGRTIRSEVAQVRAAREILRQGRSENVVVSLGAAGALLVTAEVAQRFPAHRVKVESTVGAGDSMLAGMVLALSRKASLPEAVRFGMATGAAALLGSGTQLCRPADVERLYRRWCGDVGDRSAATHGREVMPMSRR